MLSSLLVAITRLLEFVTSVPSNIDWTKSSLYASMLSISAPPVLWNLVARNEFRRRTLAKYIGPHAGCITLATIIFAVGLYREVLYIKALDDQPEYSLLRGFKTAAFWILLVTSNLLLITSFSGLGFYGTFFGDHFGILKEERVTRFPFSVLDDPMYVGSTIYFVGIAVWYERPAGLMLSLYAALNYYIALKFERPFTNMIYGKQNSDLNHRD
ncbi:phospholipid methyltransferase [Dendrothele bispora CBS 962.96]|uniref:Phosphatidyl-N-methylethanolamine N-methyltransferase n=1 Tax=Dendrothele bispora (strain CBS 962.96) TaxID=1314807 RepID=A0A4S8KWQ3_DENBC|nr:phospholipid methyltransferase [Dendrothele bispora CBS 962.96]